jgi:transposase
MADKSYAQTAVTAVTGRDLAELLRELYIERRWTDQEIAAHLAETTRIAVSRSTVRTWRAEFGVDRSERTAAIG